MERKPQDANEAESPTLTESSSEQPDTALPVATRRQFVAAISGVVVGTAACGDNGAGEEAGSGGSGASGGAAAGSGGAPSAGKGGSGGSGGTTTTSSGGTAGANGGSAGSTGGTTSANGGSAGANGGTTSSGGTAGTNAGKGGAAGASGGSPATGGTSPGGSANGGSGGTGTTTQKNANDRVILGASGVEVSRLAMGSGTVGSGGRSQQTRLGVTEFANLLVYAYEQGITFFETADAYGSHPHVAEAVRRVGRQNVQILTKTTAETGPRVEADLERFREELGVDMIDIVLLHLKTAENWTTQCAAAMEALSRAKESGIIRAHGVSCHSIEALRLAAETDWVDVDLARVNPAGVVMDAEPDTVKGVLRDMRTRRKGVIGMKIFGEGQLVNQLDACIKHAVELDAIDAFTIGFTSNAQLDEVVQKISAV